MYEKFLNMTENELMAFMKERTSEERVEIMEKVIDEVYKEETLLRRKRKRFELFFLCMVIIIAGLCYRYLITATLSMRSTPMGGISDVIFDTMPSLINMSLLLLPLIIFLVAMYEEKKIQKKRESDKKEKLKNMTEEGVIELVEMGKEQSESIQEIQKKEKEIIPFLIIIPIMLFIFVKIAS